jgi:dTMP kinase
VSERRGVLIAFEGGEASGKSTQAGLLAERLGALMTREPGGTPFGEAVRALLLDGAGTIGPRAEALLTAAARAQHVTDVIGPALARGGAVVTDRFTGSSLAYQGFGRGLSVEDVRTLSAFATEGLEPDVVVLLEVPPQVTAARRPPSADRFETAGERFHRRVLEGYASLAAAEPERWVRVDGDGTPAEVAERVWKAVEHRLSASVLRSAGE